PLGTVSSLIVGLYAGTYPDGTNYCYVHFKAYLTTDGGHSCKSAYITISFDSGTAGIVIPVWGPLAISFECGDVNKPIGAVSPFPPEYFSVLQNVYDNLFVDLVGEIWLKCQN